VVHVQLDEELASNKTEKHHKEALRAFFISLGLSNLETLAELKGGPIQVHNAALAGSQSTTAVQPTSGEIAWPDLYDINIPP
jgi:hypothetical protein